MANLAMANLAMAIWQRLIWQQVVLVGTTACRVLAMGYTQGDLDTVTNIICFVSGGTAIPTPLRLPALLIRHCRCRRRRRRPLLRLLRAVLSRDIHSAYIYRRNKSCHERQPRLVYCMLHLHFLANGTYRLPKLCIVIGSL
jgi:hypothetical protein